VWNVAVLQHAKRMKPAAISWGSTAMELANHLPTELREQYTARMASAWATIIASQF
jgi:predicted phosphoadenosine phosphosulfate sulfurtransferase